MSKIESPAEHSPFVDDGTDQYYEESAPAIEDVIQDLAKDVPQAELDKIVSDPEQERRDLIAIRDAAIMLVARLSSDMHYTVEWLTLKVAIDAQQYPKAG